MVKAALTVAPCAGATALDTHAVDQLVVVGVCDCGCRSVEFSCASGEEYQLADAVGFLESGAPVDIIIWARGGAVSSLEVVDHTAAGELPVRVCSWEDATLLPGYKKPGPKQ